MTNFSFIFDANGRLVDIAGDAPVHGYSVKYFGEGERQYELSADGPVLKIGDEHVQTTLSGILSIEVQ